MFRLNELVLATRNPGKVREMAALLADLGVTMRSLFDVPGAPEVEEDGRTFAENAVKKAETIARFTGLPALADDSGLEVDALGGAPGVFSARYAGEGASDAANNEKLLAALAGVPAERRTARYRCVLALAAPGMPTVTVEGVCEGRIAEQPRGTGGFGYDPLFYLPGRGKTMAELRPEEKNAISHRGQALRRLKALLVERGWCDHAGLGAK